jgi:pimeloyl-ACP methyl ester carboxylesterase
MYAKPTCLFDAGSSRRSPVVFIHGFLDSPGMFSAYYSSKDRSQPCLIGRRIYTFAFPNQQDNRDFPSPLDLMQGKLAREFDETLDTLAHRHNRPPAEKLVALSDGSSFRYDVYKQPEYLDFAFPVFYLRTPFDRIASTAASERHIQSGPDCRMVNFAQFNHWFPEQHSDAVLPEIRTFLGGEP